MVAAQGPSYPANLPDEVLDKIRFKKYFKEEPTQGQSRWNIAFKNLNDDGLRQLREACEILIDELKYTFLVIDVENDKAFNVLKNLQHISYRIKGGSLEYEDKKSMFSFLWSICSGFSFVTGYAEPDYVERIIESL